MKRSDTLYLALIIMVVALVIVVFTIPQEVLDSYELLFLGVVMPIMGGLWLLGYVEGMRPNKGCTNDTPSIKQVSPST
jgi:hypothetical protein